MRTRAHGIIVKYNLNSVGAQAQLIPHSPTQDQINKGLAKGNLFTCSPHGPEKYTGTYQDSLVHKSSYSTF